MGDALSCTPKQAKQAPKQAATTQERAYQSTSTRDYPAVPRQARRATASRVSRLRTGDCASWRVATRHTHMCRQAPAHRARPDPLEPLPWTPPRPPTPEFPAQRMVWGWERDLLHGVACNMNPDRRTRPSSSYSPLNSWSGLLSFLNNDSESTSAMCPIWSVCQ
jgi:hypothetical protein